MLSLPLETKFFKIPYPNPPVHSWDQQRKVGKPSCSVSLPSHLVHKPASTLLSFSKQPWREYWKMGMVVVISLPLIIFCLLLGFGCYYLGRYKGRQDVRTNAQVFGVPIPPPGTASKPPPPPHSKPGNLENV